MTHKASSSAIPAVVPVAAHANDEPSGSQHFDQAAAAGFAGVNKTYADFTEEAEFVKEMEGQLALLNRNLDQLAAKIAGSSDAVMAAARPKLQALRHQAAELNEQLEDARSTAESTRKSIHVGSWMTGTASQTGPDLARL